MGFDLAASFPASPAISGFLSLKTDFGLFFNILPHIFHLFPHFITFRNKLSTRHFELSTTDFKVIHNIELVIHTFFRVIHMLSTNRRNSAFACLSTNISKVQHVSLNRMIYKRIIFIYIDLRYVSSYDTITIILPERTGLKRQPYDKIVHVFSPSGSAKGTLPIYRE